MTERRVLVVGAGPAGMAAAIELAALGLNVTLIEQRDRPGGAIYRAYSADAACPVRLPDAHRRNWALLSRGLAEAADRIEQRYGCVFIGVDRDGRCLIDDRRAGKVMGIKAQAVIVAMGTVEQVLPRPGWELPGVCTAGGMQVQLKETGEAPSGPILIAGSGPLSLALAAQLTAAGNPPVAVLERGQPIRAWLRHPGVSLDVMRAGRYLREAMGYGIALLRAGVPYRTGWRVDAIAAAEAGLAVRCRHVNGEMVVHRVQHLALHDGLQTNDVGLPRQPLAGMLMLRAGDCREVLGAHAAMADGRRAAQTVAANLGRRAGVDPRFDADMALERRAQRALGTLLRTPADAIDADPIVCRCEGLRASDLQVLGPGCSAKEVRLFGRFGMGACQGRFCSRAVGELVSGDKGDWQASMAHDVLRWPLRPVSVAALAAYDEQGDVPHGDPGLEFAPSEESAPTS